MEEGGEKCLNGTKLSPTARMKVACDLARPDRERRGSREAGFVVVSVVFIS
jgi:hypothetical protein